MEFEEYKNRVDKYAERDSREINFQNDVVKMLLESLFPDYDVVYTGAKGPNSKSHDYYKYCGKYRDSRQIEKPTTPDLLIAKNWRWKNKDAADIIYIATVEVKSPCARNGGKKFTQLKRHLSADAITKVIYTDTMKWEFYEDQGGNDVHELKPVKSICLVEKDRTWKGGMEFDILIHGLKDFLTIK